MEIKKIPYESTWPIRQQVMWPDRPIDYVRLPQDETGTHYGLFVDDKLVSIISVFIDQGIAQFRKFATIEEYQGKGLGTKLLSFLITRLKMDGVTKIWCNARVNKTQYYERFGLGATDATFSKGAIDYVIMELVINEFTRIK